VARAIVAKRDVLIGPLDEVGHPEPVYNPAETEIAECEEVKKAELRPVEIEVLGAQNS